MIPLHIHPDKIAGIRIKAVDHRLTAAGRLHLADLLNKTVINQVGHDSGGRRDGSVIFTAQFREGELLVIDAILQNQMLQEGVSAIDMVQKGFLVVDVCHNISVIGPWRTCSVIL